ncbi:MAG TPA: NAD-dependent epimerase/dehydratase family protein, partial [Candidatus Methylomirabilis sp.]|nr:NAD-dependent epimerase/dehydratase family protein [Candidatus Methylomirabilis sp.]
LETHIARFHNIYGPNGTWFGGREKAPAAICRKVIEARDTGVHKIEIWGTGEQTRSFCFIDDCTYGIDLIMHSPDLIATPINLGTSELVSINQLVSYVEEIGGIKLERSYDLDAPKGVAGRNSDNTFIQSILHWEPCTPLKVGLKKTYTWIEQQYDARKAGERVVTDSY